MFRHVLILQVVLVSLKLAWPAEAWAQSTLQLTVHTGRGVNGYDVNSTMISGDKDTLLIDPQFSLSEAHRLAAEILALPATVDAAKTGWPARQKFWFATYGNNIPGPDPVLPEELTTPVLTLEGQQFPVTGPVPGSDGAGNSFVFIPSLKAVVAGDIVFDRVYFGVPRDKAREDWNKTIDQIMALKPEIIVPGHEGPGAKHDTSAIAFMKKYIADWDVNVSRSKNAAEMRENVVRQYPGLGMEFTLDGRINTYFPAQNQAK